MEANAGMQARSGRHNSEIRDSGMHAPVSDLNQKKLIKGVLIITALALISAVLITFLTLSSVHVGNPRVGMVMASICCLLITPPISYYHLRVSQQLEIRERHLEELNQKLQTALAEVKELGGMLPICSSCKKIRDDAGYWQQLEDYISLHSNADFTHSLCPDCAGRIVSRIPKSGGWDS
jgi:hypothetical protein